MAEILSAISDIVDVTNFSIDFAEKSAALSAKKELISIATAVLTAAKNGRTSIDYNVSSAITRLDAKNLTYAIGIIEADMIAADYQFTKTVKSNAINYKIEWNTTETTPDPQEPHGTSGEEEEPQGNTGEEE